MTPAALSPQPPGGSPAGSAVPSAAEVFTRIRTLESSFDLLRHQVEGWCVWPLLRKRVAAELAGIRPSRARGTSSRLGTAARDLIALPRLRHHDVLAKTAVSLLLEQEEGRFKNVLMDEVLLAVGDFLKIDSINSPAFAPRRASALVPGDLSSSLFDLSGSALARLLPVAGARSTAARLSGDLREGAGIEIAPDLIERVVRSFIWLKRVYGTVLRRVRPRVVLVSTVGEHALCAAAREAGLPVVEFQHGIMDRFNPGYAWTDYAVPYRATMALPTELFLFGEHWRAELASGGFWKDELRVVGSARVDGYVARRGERSAVRGRQMVWTTQGIDVARSIAFMSEFLRRVDDADFALRVKLHPLYDADRTPYRAAFGDDPRVTVEGAEDGPSTFAALVDADLHASIYSASHYDAIGLGVPTVVLPFDGHDVVGSLVDRGHATLARDPEHLATIWRARNRLVPSEAVREHYFRPCAIANVEHALARVLPRFRPDGRRGRN